MSQQTQVQHKSPYLIKKVKPNEFDLFVGVGWDNWTRFEVKADGAITVLKGKALSHQLVDFIQVHYLKVRTK